MPSSDATRVTASIGRRPIAGAAPPTQSAVAGGNSERSCARLVSTRLRFMVPVTLRATMSACHSDAAAAKSADGTCTPSDRHAHPSSAIMVWAITYDMVGIVPDRQDTFYFAFANYTTLGYGDIIPIKRWRLLGPMTAMNGMLLFGWSAAVIFDVLRTIARVTPEPSSTPE